MALVKDLIVQGNARFLNDAFFAIIKSGTWNGSPIDLTHGGTAGETTAGKVLVSTATSGTSEWKLQSALSVGSATTATYASNVGASGTAGTNYVTAAKVIAACNWYDTMIGTDSNTVIDRWSEIVAFVANFTETPDLATFLANNYLALTGNSTATPMTGTIYVKDVTPIYLHSTNLDLDVWRVSGNSNSIFDNTFGFYLHYKGTGSGDGNTLSLWADNQNATDDVEVYRVQQSGVLKFLQTPKVIVNGTDVAVSLTTHTHAFSDLTSHPTTLSGYGITDAAPAVDGGYLPLSGGTMTGAIKWQSSLTDKTGGWNISGSNQGLFILTHTSESITGSPARYSIGIHVGGYYNMQIATSALSSNQHLYWRYPTSDGTAWKTLLDSSNYTSYTVQKDGTGATGTWGISISGNADTVDNKHASDFADASHDHDGVYVHEKDLTPPSDYIDFVILLCSLENTTNTQYADYYCGGTIFLKRHNVFAELMQKIDFFVGKNSAAATPNFCNVQASGGLGAQLITCTYNSKPYAAFYIKVDSSKYAWGKFLGVSSNFDDIQIIGIYKHQGSTTEVLNSEIYNSLAVISTTESVTTFYNTPKVTLDHGVTKKDIYHSGNLTPATLTLSTSDQTFITAGGTAYKLKLPATSPYSFDDVYLKLTGGTVTDTVTLKAGAYAVDNTWTYPGGSYRSVQKPNLRLIGDSTYGLSTIEFISQKGDTSINKPSDCAFIQFQPYGTGTLAAIGSAPTLNNSGEVNRLVIGVSNDSNDILVLQTPATTGLKHVVATNSYTIWDAGNDGSGSGLDADLLDGFHAADFRNNIVDLRTNPQTFNPTYLKDIVFISEADYTTLVSNGSITKNSITHTYNASNWYVIEDKVPEYAENAGNADYASNAGWANAAGEVDWSDVLNPPDYTIRWPYWSEVMSKPTWVTWSESSSTSSYSLSSATWAQTITLPTTAGSYILNLKAGNSTFTGLFSIGSGDTVKDEISLHFHGTGTRLYARTNGTKLELSSSDTTATSVSVTIKYRRII